jgi:hypothetical protein
MNKKHETDLATREHETGLTAYDYGTDAGAGFEVVDKNFVSLPYINLLQALSPEVANPDEIVDGAKPGKFINSVSKEIFDTVTIQPVSMRRVYVQWKPDRGGKVAEHFPESEVVRKAIADNKATPGSKFTDLFAEDDVLVETYYVLALQHTNDGLLPVMLSFTSTKIRAFKEIITRISTARVGGKQPPLFAHRWQLNSFGDRNAANQPFFNVKIVAPIDNNVIKSLIPPDSEYIAAAIALKAAYDAGDAKPVDQSAEIPF